MIPITGEVQYLKDKPLMYYTIEAAKKSKYIKSIIVSTDNMEIANVANGIGAETPFLRDTIFSEDYIDIVRVFQHSLEQLDSLKKFPDILVTMKTTFPFRPPNIIDNMIEQLFDNGLDSIIAAKYENKSIWKGKDGKIELIDEGLTPRQYKDPTFIGLRGLCCVTHPEFLREGSMFGQNIGIYEIDSPLAHFEVRSEKEFVIAGQLVDITDIL
jgi:CMP-N-acetylneuraminic acid synthetase